MSGSNSKAVLGLALAPLLALGACTVAPPTGPSITALPGPGKTWAQFQADDANCQNYAQYRMSGSGQEAAAAGQNANGTAVAGTLIGAAAGAALGAIGGNAGAGAAIGAGAGLLGGASVAGNQAQSAADSMQGRYDRFYAQCMVGNGEVLQQPAQPPPVFYAPPPPVYYSPW
jgi:Glycine-zipper domain